VAPSIGATSGGIGLSYQEALTNQMANYQTPTPQGSVTVGQPTDVNSVIAGPSFASQASQAMPGYAAYSGY
jgi:hypothetical protein